MKEKIYTIKNLCDELNQPRQKISGYNGLLI